MNHQLQCVLMLVGRVFFSLIFLLAGIDKVMHFESIAAMMTSKGLMYGHYLLGIATVIELGAGLMILLGWKTRLGGLLIFLFVLPVTFVFHSFWSFSDAEAANQMYHFMKNLTIMGGALYIIATGGGAYSLDKIGWKEKHYADDSDHSTH